MISNGWLKSWKDVEDFKQWSKSKYSGILEQIKEEREEIQEAERKLIGGKQMQQVKAKLENLL